MQKGSIRAMNFKKRPKKQQNQILSDAVVGDSSTGKLKNNKKKPYLPIAISAVLIITVISLIGYYYARQGGYIGTTEEEASPQMLLSSEELADLASQSQDPADIASFYGRQSEVKQLEGDIEGALASAIKATEYYPADTNLSRVAGIAESKGDINLAIEYYQKAMNASEPTEDYDAAVPYNIYRFKIVELQKL
jgi:tetratricopeptide (TPR) repeat protein